MADAPPPYNTRASRKRRASSSVANDDAGSPSNIFLLPFPGLLQRQPIDDDPTPEKPIVLRSPEEAQYFDSLTSPQREQLADTMREILAMNPTKPLKFHILESSLPPAYKRTALQKLESFQNMSEGSAEYLKVRQWVDGVMNIPFGIYRPLPVVYDGNNAEQCREFLAQGQRTMDEAVFGMHDAKSQVLQLMAQWMSNPSSMGQVLALQGPPGIGKTCFVQNGISKVLDRPFFFVSLGGSTDGSFLTGHGYTYKDSRWGKILEIIMHAQCMNPVIFFDEVDKVSETAHGQEIINVLMHLTDPSQNSHYMDRYYPEIAIDMSKVLFVFSLNDESKVNRVLRDRMTMLRLPGYDFNEKLAIATRYLIPKLLVKYGLPESAVDIPTSTLEYLLKGSKEQGLRNTIRMLEKLLSRLNLLRLSGDDFKTQPWYVDYSEPFRVTVANAAFLLRDSLAPVEKDVSLQMMYL